MSPWRKFYHIDEYLVITLFGGIMLYGIALKMSKKTTIQTRSH